MRDGVAETVELQRWVWLALYKDGTYLMQFDNETGLFHQLQEIEQDKLDVFVMQHHADATKRYEIHWQPHYKLIHFYRKFRNEEMPENEWQQTYCFGYEVKDSNGMVTKMIFEIYPNDVVAITSDDGRNN